MKITNNLGLKKIELTDSPPDITVQDSNWDLIDETLKEHEDAIGQVNSQLAQTTKAEKAGGTATAITLSAITLTDGSIKTFIAKVDNNAVATTINGKPLYKPNTTTTPKLKANTAVVVWYDLIGDCFFIKASAGGGTATKAAVLDTVTFSSDTVDEESGNIPSKTSATYTPRTLDQSIASGQYLSGEQTIKGDANLVPANIAKGTTIFNVAGTLDTRQLNFPLSIQDAEPSPLRAGHIWVKSSTLEAQITMVKILEALNGGEADGTLMLVVGDLALHGVSYANTVDVTGGGTKSVSITDTKSSSADWDIMSKTGGVASSYKINRPIVYSKVGGSLQIETAYMYNGNSWVMLSQKGTYAISISNQSSDSSYPSFIYNLTGDTFSVVNSTLNFGSHESHSKDGTYVIIYKTVYKRVGDVFTPYYTFSTYFVYNSINHNTRPPYVSPSGNRFFLPYYYYYSSPNNYKYGVITFVDNGSTLVMEYIKEMGMTASTPSHTFHCINSSGTFFIVNDGDCWYINDGALIKGTRLITDPSLYSYVRYYNAASGILSLDENYVIMKSFSYSSGSSSGPYIDVFTLDAATGTLSYKQRSTYSVSNSYSFCAHPFGYILLIGQSDVYAYTISDNTLNSSAGTIATYYYFPAFNADGTRLLGHNNSTGIGYFSVLWSGATFTFTLISTKTVTGTRGKNILIPSA